MTKNNKLKINLVILGNLKYYINMNKIINWKSKCFEITGSEIIEALPDTDCPDWTYSDNILDKLFNHDNSSDFTVGLINASLEYNYYVRRLSDNKCVLSLHETGDILLANKLDIDNFVLRNIYEFVLIFKKYNGKIPENVYSVAHEETRGCLFDLSAHKDDIIFSTQRPIICEQCKAEFNKLQLPDKFISHIDKELKKLRKKLYFRIADFIKMHPIFSILITLLFAIIIEIIANILWELIKSQI